MSGHLAEGVRIRRATLADREGLLELAREVFEETRTDKANELSAAFWDWQFARQPANRMWIWVAETAGRIIGQIPANVVRMKWNQEELIAATTIDLMVHAEHRDKSLFIKVGRLSLRAMAKEGIDVSIGLPNKNSLPGAVRFLRHQLVGQVPFLVRPIRWSRLLERTNVPAWLTPALGVIAAAGDRLTRLPIQRIRNVRIYEAESFPKEMDELWARSSAPHKIICTRDQRYLNWRYPECPTRRYRIYLAECNGRIVGYLVHRVIDKDGLRLGAVMDILVEPKHKEAMHALIGQAVESLRHQKVDAIIALMQQDTDYYAALRRWGFWRVPERLNPRTFNLVCHPIREDLPKDEFGALRNWFITLGDYDVY